MGLKIGVLGAGQFAGCFIPLFQAHPYVEEVVVAEWIPERRAEAARRFGIKRTFADLDELLRSDVDAVALFTQRHLHGAQAVDALKAGKHVYSAVPLAQSLEEVHAIMEEVIRSGLIYMSGETSYYYPSAVYCREQFKAGAFGDFVYGEAQYLHDMEHGFYDAFKYSGGKDWKRVAGIPPMLYPTHSVSMITSVTGARVTKVACLGYEDRHPDGIFRAGANQWDNPFSNETAIARTSDGGMARLNEFRRVGWGGKNSVYMSMFGTLGSYEEHAGGSAWSSLDWGKVEDLGDLLNCEDVYKLEEALGEGMHAALQQDFYSKRYAKVHHRERLPDSYNGMPNGHFGSHQFLADDFMKAVKTGMLPPNHVWQAAGYLLPGLVSHESAMRGGEWLEVPDFGRPPAHWELLDPESRKAEAED